jgi:hypothetical protein
VDEQHASLVDATIRRFRRAGWEVHPEVSFSSYGERGSIDVLALSREHAIVVVVEVKSGIWNVEETIRRHDVKARLAIRIVEERFGWRPRLMVRVLVVPDNTTVRRQVERHAPTFGSVYPGRTRDFGHWLQRPASAVGSLVFLPLMHDRSLGRRATTSSRVSAQAPRSSHRRLSEATPRRCAG